MFNERYKQIIKIHIFIHINVILLSVIPFLPWESKLHHCCATAPLISLFFWTRAHRTYNKWGTAAIPKRGCQLSSSQTSVSPLFYGSATSTVWLSDLEAAWNPGCVGRHTDRVSSLVPTAHAFSGKRKSTFPGSHLVQKIKKTNRTRVSVNLFIEYRLLLKSHPAQLIDVFLV